MRSYITSQFYRRLFFFLLLISSFSFVLWLFIPPKKLLFTILPVTGWHAERPIVKITICSKPYLVIFDLGSRLEVELYEDRLVGLPLKYAGIESFTNFKGNQFEYPKFIAPKIELGSLSYKDRQIVSRPLSDLCESVILGFGEAVAKADRISGFIGRGILTETNILLDMKTSKIVLTNCENRLLSEGYDLESFLKTPFLLDAKGLIFEIETDLGKGRFLLDTGATVTLLQKQCFPIKVSENESPHPIPYIKTERFIINGADFGSQKLFFIEIAKKLKVDGILGMDFIRNHVMYIDFTKQLLYIQRPPKNRSL